LATHAAPVARTLQPGHTPHALRVWPQATESAFRNAMADHAMARIKLQEGIDAFVRDTQTLLEMIQAELIQ
jgi:transaldolase